MSSGRPKFIAAAVQDAPVYLNAAATTDKACKLIAQAAANGAKIVAFPEVFLPGYPYWNWLLSPIEGSPWFERLYKTSVELEGAEIGSIREAARQANIIVVIGINERRKNLPGTLYNSIVTIGSDGSLLGCHRKFVPTWAEKLTWGGGDGSSLVVHDTEIGNVGVLACGENTNPLARFALLAQGEQIHVASYIALPVAPADYDMADAIRLRGTAHSFEGKVFTIISCSTISEEIIAAFPGHEDMMRRKSSSFSAIIGPDGRVIGEPLIDKPGICYAEIDLDRTIAPKQMHDIIGHYNRFDIFDLRINRRQLSPVTLENNAEEHENA